MKKKVHAYLELLPSTCTHRVVVVNDHDAPNPLDTASFCPAFFLHSMTTKFAGSEAFDDYEDPFEDADDGAFRPKPGIVCFPVSCIDHGMLSLHLGDTKPNWDVVNRAAVMWTSKARYEKAVGEWMTVRTGDGGSWREANSEEEFREFLRELAADELDVFQNYLDGNCYRYYTERRRDYVKTYDDGTTERGCEWEDCCDGCGGYYIRTVDDMDFDHGPTVEVVTLCPELVGQEWSVRTDLTSAEES